MSKIGQEFIPQRQSEMRRRLDNPRLLSDIFFDAGPWLIGVILGVAIAKSIESFTSMDFTTVLLICLLFLLGALTYYLKTIYAKLFRYSDEVRRSRFHRLAIHRDLPGIEGSNAFSYCETVVNQARRSIVIVGPHFTNKIRVGTDSHTKYLENGVDRCVSRHIESGSDDTFYYTRIVQLDVDTFKGFRNHPNNEIVDEAFFANDGLAKHVKKCLEIGKETLNFKCRVYGREFIPSFPSILIVDDTYLFFSLPSMASYDGKSDDQIKYDLVLSIEDATHEIPKLFRQIVEQFENQSLEIKAVRSSSSARDEGEQTERNSQDKELTWKAG